MVFIEGHHIVILLKLKNSTFHQVVFNVKSTSKSQAPHPTFQKKVNKAIKSKYEEGN
jgi:hypothetical protein